MMYSNVFLAFLIGGVACTPTRPYYPTTNTTIATSTRYYPTANPSPWCGDKPEKCGGVCGDGHVQAPYEECDLGAENGKPGSGCSKECKKVPCCGDGKLEWPEECDLGADNGTPGSGCSKECKKTCGNGIVDSGEECDAGSLNGEYNSGCSTNCTICGYCGDGIVDKPEEECDLGWERNGAPGSGCSRTCTKIPTCTPGCSQPKCGDGNIDKALGEECDDGANNGKESSSCTTTCKLKPPTTGGNCETCNPNPFYNKCAITTSCFNTLPGNKHYCACRAGYRANNLSPADPRQFRLAMLGQEYRVFVAPGVECDTLCTSPHPGPGSCQEVPVKNDC
ncbi:hypothetical protein QBC35DRAFT_443328 [Podospora australis]|uniref:EGF-like domain-containing protein n=1 Tax=Podospora australis TaxID=1536484 RepID=A0AAN6WKF0_9PEZI|nr:hypothetical protein QBC35DRAFT_443328 [Podospora australis]